VPAGHCVHLFGGTTSSKPVPQNRGLNVARDFRLSGGVYPLKQLGRSRSKAGETGVGHACGSAHVARRRGRTGTGVGVTVGVTVAWRDVGTGPAEHSFGGDSEPDLDPDSNSDADPCTSRAHRVGLQRADQRSDGCSVGGSGWSSWAESPLRDDGARTTRPITSAEKPRPARKRACRARPAASVAVGTPNLRSRTAWARCNSVSESTCAASSGSPSSCCRSSCRMRRLPNRAMRACTLDSTKRVFDWNRLASSQSSTDSTRAAADMPGEAPVGVADTSSDLDLDLDLDLALAFDSGSGNWFGSDPDSGSGPDPNLVCDADSISTRSSATANGNSRRRNSARLCSRWANHCSARAFNERDGLGMRSAGGQ